MFNYYYFVLLLVKYLTIGKVSKYITHIYEIYTRLLENNDIFSQAVNFNSSQKNAMISRWTKLISFQHSLPSLAFCIARHGLRVCLHTQNTWSTMKNCFRNYLIIVEMGNWNSLFTFFYFVNKWWFLSHFSASLRARTTAWWNGMLSTRRGE